MPSDPKEPVSSEDLIRRARDGLDTDSSDGFQLPTYTAVRREAEAARTQREEERAAQEAADRQAPPTEPSAAITPDSSDPGPAETLETADDDTSEVAAGYGTLEPLEEDADAYGPMVTTGEPVDTPPKGRSFSFGWLRWVIAAGFIAFALFRFFDPSTPVDSLSVGDCFDDPGGDEIASVDLIDCTELHDFEIFALVQLTGNGESFPGDDALVEELAEQCLSRFDGYVGRDFATSVYDISGLTPLEDSWSGGDREGVCLLFKFDNAGLVKKRSSAANAGI